MTQLVSTGVFFGSAFYVSMVEVAARYRYTEKKVSDFPVPNRDVINQALPDGE
jgi:hypothetical protein